LFGSNVNTHVDTVSVNSGPVFTSFILDLNITITGERGI
jgi:hypothetical protein